MSCAALGYQIYANTHTHTLTHTHTHTHTQVKQEDRHTSGQFDGRGGDCHIDCVCNRQIISLVCQERVDEELSPQDLNSETMATVGGVGDEKEQIYKCWILLGLGRCESRIKAVES